MERKYKIMSVANIMKMMIRFADQSDQIHEISVGVDLVNGKVYFDAIPELASANFDFEDLEQEILARVRPTGPELPKFSPEIFQKIMEVKSSNYGSKKYGEL